jgi:hypothetical protein
MADTWIHKESNFELHTIMVFNDSEGADFPRLMSQNENADGHTFTQWLDIECEDGWEVLKISRVFNSFNSRTWVVFRKQA